jgi:hypothetical protein
VLIYVHKKTTTSIPVYKGITYFEKKLPVMIFVEYIILPPSLNKWTFSFKLYRQKNILISFQCTLKLQKLLLSRRAEIKPTNTCSPRFLHTLSLLEVKELKRNKMLICIFLIYFSLHFIIYLKKSVCTLIRGLRNCILYFVDQING